jgi:hypothetical protein
MRFYVGKPARVIREAAASTPAIIEGLVVPFTEPTADGAEFQGVDLFRTYFNKKTNYYLGAGFHTVRSFYRHGQDETLRDRLLGVSELQVREANGDDPAGVWAETQLAMADEYDEKILELVKAGKLRQSSGVPETMYEVKPVKIGKRELGYVTRWGIIENSFTPTPASFGTDAQVRTLTAIEFARLFRREDLPAEESNGNLFLEALSKYIPSRWDIEDMLCKVIANVAMLAKVASQTGSAFDYEAKVDEVMAGYSQVMAAHIKPQIADYIQSSMEERFYLRSVAIDDSTIESHTRALESGVADLIRRFSGRRDNRGANRGLNAADAGRLNAFRAALQRGVVDADRISRVADAAPPELISEEQARELRKNSSRKIY